MKVLKILMSLLAMTIVLMVANVPAAHASTNVIPNGGFEQGGCGSTPTICGWQSDSSISMLQDTSDPHSGAASMHLGCGADGCYADPDTGWGTIGAFTPACVPIAIGAHAASFWYRDAVGAQVSLEAAFYDGKDCTSSDGADSLVQAVPSGGGWQQVVGMLHAPIHAQSVQFSLRVGGWCADTCPSFAANFDDVSVDESGDPTPTIASFTPTRGWYGNRVWIYGFDFTGATSVTFNGVPAQFTVGSDGFIDTSVPNGATSGPISVTTPYGTVWSSSSFTLQPPPTISSFAPAGGPIGTSVDILGSHFTGATSVSFTGGKADFTVDSDSEIHATPPFGAKTGPIQVTTPEGTATSSASFAIPTPTITSFAPASGPVGTVVDIHGTNLTETMWVSFSNTVLGSFTVDSDTEIHATVPDGAQTGLFYVVTSNGSAASPSSFNLPGPPPTMSSVTPVGGPVGTVVDIHGSNFTGANAVSFNGTAATSFAVDSDSEIHATVPEGATSGQITVKTPNGIIRGDYFFVVHWPSISSVTPKSGPVGTSVDIHGAGLSGTTSVGFNGTAAVFTVDSDFEMHATVPAGATNGPILVTTPEGTAPSADSFTVEPSCSGVCSGVGSASILEGNSGTQTLRFSVTLSQPSTVPVSVGYSVTGDTATVAAKAGAGVDVIAKASGTVHFSVGTTGVTAVSKPIAVQVVGDTAVEPDETFTLRLTGVTGATIGAQGTATGTVIDDDTAAGVSVGVGDSAIVEGNAGMRWVIVPVTLSAMPAAGVSVSYTVTAGTATYASRATTPNGDYGGAKHGTLTFAAGGPTTRQVVLRVWPDTVVEPNETFMVTITNVSAGVSIVRPTGTATIIDDD